MNFVELFQNAVKNYPKDIALVDYEGARSTTYTELDILSSRIAGKLRATGCRNGDFVMILMGRRMEYIASYIGILKAGCVVIPLIPDYPEERVNYIRNNSEAKLLIDEDFVADADQYEEYVGPVDDKAPALLIYTSGSTGTPKGILHTAGDLAHSTKRQVVLYEGISPLVYAASTPLSFMAHAFEYLTVLYLGGTVHMLSERIRKSADEMANYYLKHGITFGCILPQLIKIYKNKSKTLQGVVTGSERVVNAYSKDYQINNMYGMSEMTGLCSIMKIDKFYDNTPVGKAFPDVELMILDEDGKSVPNGTEGEICARGMFNARYFKDPERSARTMIECEDGTTIIHTGDIGYINEQGDVVFVNRMDWMVKINGQRVDTLEIETLLNHMPELNNAAVKAFEDADGQTYLVAYYIPNAAIDEDEMRSRLEAKLPYYMIPRFFVKMDAFPLNVNGKLNRLAFEAPTSGEFRSEFVAPTNELEKAICLGFEEVLRCGAVGINDDFFALGGDSIKVLKLLAAIQHSELTTNKILTGRTPKGIAALCSAKASININHSEDIPEFSPLTDSQRGVYIECMEDPESTMYNIPMLCRLPENVDVQKFIAAIRRVASKHPALSVTIGAPHGEPGMLYHNQDFAVAESEVSDLAEKCRDFVQPFDLEKGPLCRFEIVKHSEGIAFLFDIHHLIFDGTSTETFIAQIADVYNGGDCRSEKLTIFDVAAAEETIKNSAEYHKAQEFFLKKFGDAEFDSKPIPDQVLDTELRGGGTICTDVKDIFTISEVSEFTKRHKISENTLFLGAFAYALAKYNGSRESFFCTVNNGRHDPRLDSSIGMFVRTMPLCYNIDEKQSIASFLPAVQDDFYRIMDNDCMSFGELAAEYGVNTDVTFVYQAEMFNGAKLGRDVISIEPLDAGDCQTELDLMLIKKADGFELLSHYKKASYTPEFIRGLSKLFLNVVREMMTRNTLAEIELLDAEDHAMLDGFNSTECEYNKNTTLVELFREQASKTPDNICLVYADKKFTYREVDDLTDRLAAHLISCGVSREKVVGVLIPRSEHMLLASLGVLKAGGAYLPLDPSYPAERLNMMVKDSAAIILIADPKLDSIIDESFTGIRMKAEDIYGLEPCSMELPTPKPRDLFIMLYTSGSTGTPKGVMFEHSNALVTAQWVRKFYEMDETTHAASYASYGFDANVFDTYAPIISGGALYIIPEDMRLDFNALRDYFNTNAITTAVMTTQVGRQFAQMEGIKTLRHLSVAGEKLTPPEVPAGFNMYNLYGPTEGSVVTSWFRIEDKYRDVPIGKPVDNLKAYIVDADGRLLPPGAVGELWISGKHVTRGYLNRPEKMLEAYGANPFSKDPEYSRVYRTGDMIRYMHDGSLQFIGRHDGQVKIRGFRIELTEIEEVIRRYPGIKDATIAAWDDKSGGKFVAAYVVADEEVNTEDLSRFIASEKPPYMVPAVIMQLDSIPLNQNQKVNKRALPVPKRNVGEIVAPENATQQKIWDIVSEAIGHREFGVTTDLYYAGLTSISSVKLNVDLSKEFGISIKIADIKANSTVKALEQFISGSETVTEYEILDDYPITETQRGIFVESMSAADTTVYNIPVLMKLSPAIDIDRLAGAIRTTINAHPYVKARLYTNDHGEIRVRRNDTLDAIVTIRECSVLPKLTDIVRPFKLFAEPLYRVCIYVTDEGNYLLMDFHHIISDGTSEAIMFSEINRAYNGEAIPTETYTGYEAALDEEAVRSSDSYKKAEQYWSKLLSGCETGSLPKKNSLEKDEAAASRDIYDGSYLADIRNYCEKHHVTMNAFFNSVFAYVIRHFSGKEELSYSTIYNGRSDSRLAESVMMCVKTMPVAVSLKNDIDIPELIGQMQDQLMNSMANDCCSFAELSSKYGVNSDIIFAYQGEDFNFDTLCGEKFEMIPVQASAAKAPLSLNIYVVGDELRYSAEYRRDCFSEEFIDCFIDAVNTAAGSFTRSRYLKEVSMLSDKALAVYDALNDTDYEISDLLFHQLFERTAKAYPDATALITSVGSITFGELNNRANIMAHALIERGIGKENIVGIILERSKEVVIAELAVIKAGAAILPMLPSYPDDRLEYCLTDSGSPLVITTDSIKSDRGELFTADKPYTAVTVEELLSGGNTADPGLDTDPHQLICCIYTSGSTGKPKGVMIEHHSLTNLIQDMWSVLTYYTDASNNGAALAISSVSFDMSIFDIYVPLLYGKTVYMAFEDEIHNPLAISDVINNNNIQMFLGTPSYVNNLVSMPVTEAAMSRLKSLMLGAEAFPAALYDKLKAINPEMQILNGYGPTETTVCSSTKELTSGEGITIGKPNGNVQYYVMDSFGNILPPYAVGELIIAGEGVSRGYINLPEKTRAAFFTLNGRPAYHSGDSVRLTADAEIEFGGRIDNQVKLRGFRVELDEIEKVMCSYEGIKLSKVIVRNNGTEDYLAAFFTADREIDLNALTQYLKSQLTYYMVPAAMMQLDQMPLTANGKIDKKNLPEIQKKAAGRSRRRAPRKSLEQRLCEIFSDVLGMDEIFADDDFFELGGTSLTASKVTMMLMSEGIEVEYGDIFSNPTPETLAEFVEKRNGISTETRTEGVAVSKKEQIEALKYNVTRYAKEVKREPLGDVLLTGAVGFLGIHVLKELFELEEGHITCMVRRGSFETPEARLKSMLFYYFSENFDDIIRERVSLIEADITDDSLPEQLADIKFDTILNCAACVKHFVNDDILERINVHGVENLINVAKARNCKLIQISTVSVPGIHTDESYANQVKMHENELFVIDDMNNKYGISKYHAELKIIGAIDEGLRAKIIRVGNLMGRHSDGEFQINLETNMFLNGIRGFATMGKYPISHMTDPMRFSPIDCTARAVVLLAGTNDIFTAFNADSRYGFDEMKIIDACNRNGISIYPEEDDVYYEEFNRKLADNDINSKLTGLAAYDIKDAHAVETDNLFTTNILYRIGFSWPLVDDDYLDRAINSIMTMDFFGTDDIDDK